MDTKRAIMEYCDHLSLVKGIKHNTIIQYRSCLIGFVDSTDTNKMENINTRSVNWFKRRLGEDGKSIKTQNQYLISLRGFLKFCAMNDIKTLYYGKVELIQDLSTKQINIPTLQELKRLIESFEDVRSRAIMEVLLSTGLKISELVKLDAEKIETTLFLSNDAREALKKYLNGRERGPLFTNVKGNRLSQRTIQRMIKDQTERIGIKRRITPQTIRNLFATTLVGKNTDILSVQKALGHKNTSATIKYFLKS